MRGTDALQADIHALDISFFYCGAKRRETDHPALEIRVINARQVTRLLIGHAKANVFAQGMLHVGRVLRRACHVSFTSCPLGYRISPATHVHEYPESNAAIEHDGAAFHEDPHRPRSHHKRQEAVIRRPKEIECCPCDCCARTHRRLFLSVTSRYHCGAGCFASQRRIAAASLSALTLLPSVQSLQHTSQRMYWPVLCSAGTSHLPKSGWPHSKSRRITRSPRHCGQTTPLPSQTWHLCAGQGPSA